jgi:hypothetical protein
MGGMRKLILPDNTGLINRKDPKIDLNQIIADHEDEVSFNQD